MHNKFIQGTRFNTSQDTFLIFNKISNAKKGIKIKQILSNRKKRRRKNFVHMKKARHNF